VKKVILTSLALSSLLFSQSVQEIITANGCMTCHAISTKKNAPAFAGIGKRNQMQNGNNAKAVIMSSIKNGSSGKYQMFSNTSMPPYQNLSTEELELLANYILAQSSKASGQHNGQGGGQGHHGQGNGGGHGGGHGR
jgi:cytochrome c551/c552